MKAKELMCDDVVSHNGNFYKVFGVMGRADGVQITPIHLRNSDGLLPGPISCFGSDIEPIPLTPEILEKNGWEKEYISTICNFIVGCCDMMIRITNNNLYMEISMFRGVKITYPNIHYVHELQHALRLCGLDELADNFIV